MITNTVGELLLTAAEKSKLAELRATAKYEQHQLYPGLYQQDMPFDNVPTQLQEIIKNLQGTITVAKVVKVVDGVEKHIHQRDSEIYYFGDGKATLKLYDKSGQLIESILLSADKFALTHQFEAHEMVVEGETEFYGVKFVEAGITG